MKTLKQFNTLSPDKQCEFAIDLIENESVMIYIKKHQ